MWQNPGVPGPCHIVTTWSGLGVPGINIKRGSTLKKKYCRRENDKKQRFYVSRGVCDIFRDSGNLSHILHVRITGSRAPDARGVTPPKGKRCRRWKYQKEFLFVLLDMLMGFMNPLNMRYFLYLARRCFFCVFSDIRMKHLSVLAKWGLHEQFLRVLSYGTLIIAIEVLL